MAIPVFEEQAPDVLARLPLDVLNHVIALSVAYVHGGASQGRKAFFKCRVMLERIREQVHGIEATPRACRTR